MAQWVRRVDLAPHRQGLHDQSQPGRSSPKEFQFATDEVVIRKVGDDVILSPCPRDWKTYLASAPVASDAFMADVEGLPVQERER
jgi:antitoxin VapB